MKIETKINQQKLNASTITITTNVREITQGKLAKALIAAKKKKKGNSADAADDAITPGEGEPSNDFDHTGVVSAGTLDEVIQVLDAVTSIPEVNEKYGRIAKPTKSAIKVYKKLARKVRIYQKLAPKITRLVKIIGIRKNKAFIADLAKDKLGKVIKSLVFKTFAGLYGTASNTILNYPIVIRIGSDGISSSYFNDLYYTFNKLKNTYVETLIYAANQLPKFIEDLYEFIFDLDEDKIRKSSVRQQINNYILLSNEISPYFKQALINLLNSLSLDEAKKSINYINAINLGDILSKMTGDQIKKFFETLNSLGDTERDNFLENLRKLSTDDVVAVFNAYETTDSTYNNKILNDFNNSFRNRERSLLKKEEELFNTPLVKSLKKVQYDYLEDFYLVFGEYTYVERFEFIAYLNDNRINGLNDELKMLMKDEIMDSTEDEFQMLKIVILSILYE